MKLIVAFPGTGKTDAEAYLKLKGIPSIDYDSKEVNKEEGWEEKYVENIVEFIKEDKYDYIFASFNEKVIEVLSDKEIEFSIVVPEDTEITKQMIFGRYLLRNEGFNHVNWIKRQAKIYDRCKEENIKKFCKNNNIYFISPEHPYILDIEELFI